MKEKTKEEQVAEFLREGIISGRFGRGQKLKQAQVAYMLGLSITPVREAFKLLEAEGYLLGNSRRGVVVAPFDLAHAQEVLDLRVALESQLALAAMERLDKTDLEVLLALQEELEGVVAKGDRDAVRALNYRFHRRLYTRAELPLTLHFVNILWAKYPFDLINRVEGRIHNAAREHAELIQALCASDRPRLLIALREHILTGWNEFRRSQPFSQVEQHMGGEANPSRVERRSDPAA